MKDNNDYHPKISIVTPTFNQGQFIEETILSVLGQFYPNLEYFIFDGGSVDNTVDIINKYEDNITFWVSEKDKGQAAAINRGFKKATGDILMWLNSDDLLMPNALNFIANSYRQHGDAIYFGNCLHFKESKRNNGVFATGSNVIKQQKNMSLNLSDYIIQPSSFWSKNVWETNGDLNENYHYAFDWEWFLRAKKKDITFVSLNKPLSIYRFHDNHKSGLGGINRQKEILEIYKLYGSKYAALYELVMNENFEMSFFEKIIAKAVRVVLNKKINKVHFLKVFKKRKYHSFKTIEINQIRGML